MCEERREGGLVTTRESVDPLWVECGASEVGDQGIYLALQAARESVEEALAYKTFGKEARHLLEYAAGLILACVETGPTARLEFATSGVVDMETALRKVEDGDA